MDVSAFWALIDASRGAGAGDIEAQVAALTDALAKLPPDAIIAFDGIFRDHLARAYRWDLWAAAYIINGGCSDDGFEYFRSWLIVQGEQVFNAALADPETLVDRAEPDAEGEGMLHAASEAFDACVGAKLPLTSAHPPEPAGERWSEDELPRRFPRLWSMFT